MEIALPVWLVDMLISLAVIFLVIDIEFLVRFNLYHFSCKIVRIENNIAVIVGILHRIYCFFLTLSINADYLV